MKMESKDLHEGDIEKIETLFPEVVTEVENSVNGKYEKKIDFDALKERLSGEYVESIKERYEFTWPGKKQAKAMAFTPIKKTLRPCKKDSKNWDSTENIYIEGDNLDALKILQESYLGKIKLIYIDPPYNTGADFIYSDNYHMTLSEYEATIKSKDDSGNVLFKNTESNGRFHSDWCSSIYSRLVLSKNLLSRDGSIFISIDDNEVQNLRKICDEIFGESNFVAQIVWKRKRGRDNSAKWFSKSHEYLLLYAKNKDCFKTNNLELDDETKNAYKNPDDDPRGKYRMLGCWARGTQGGVKYDFTTKTGQYFSERLWLMSKDNLKKLDDDDKLIIRGDNIYRKMFIYENKGKIPETLWSDVSNAANASDEIKKMFDEIVFDTPKPVPYIAEMLKIASSKNDIILDFYSGSATTANAVMQQNADDGGHRKFIMVQLPESITNNENAIKMGFNNICDIGKERIRRAGNNINGRIDGKDVDTGFRVFKIDSTNMKDVYYSSNEYVQGTLNGLIDNIKDDRTPDDLLAAIMVDWGLELSLPYESITLDNNTVYSVDHNMLIACFDTEISEMTIRSISKMKPTYAVFRDSSFKNIQDKINLGELFKNESPETVIKVL